MKRLPLLAGNALVWAIVGLLNLGLFVLRAKRALGGAKATTRGESR